MYKSFVKNILHHDTSSDKSAEIIFWNQNIRMMKIAVFAVIGISLYWAIADLTLDSYNLSLPSKIAILAQLLASIYMSILTAKSKNPNYSLMRISFIIFYAILIVGTCILTVSRNLDIIHEGAYSPYIGVSVSTFYIFFIVLMPLPRKRDLAFLCALMYVCLLLPDIFVMSSSYSLLSHIVICLCFSAAMFFDRNIFYKNAEHQVENVKLSEELTAHALLDSLTGALNRRAMDDYIEYLVNNSSVSRIGVIFFDIDYFKKYNDFYGHVKGDEILKQVVNIATQSIGNTGKSYLFRYGGEEFIILMENADEATLTKAMAHLKDDVFDANIIRDDIELFDRITITAGGALEDAPNKNGDYVLAADTQLYIGKAAYRNAAYYQNRKIDVGKTYARNVLDGFSIRKQSKAWLFETYFRSAMDSGEFEVWCQPKYESNTAVPSSAEALIRWRLSDGSMLKPGEFIPVFEADGLISEIDTFVFRYVCQKQKEFLDKGFIPIPISVNMARATLFSPGTIDNYQKIIDEIGISKDLVPLEITESTEADNNIISRLTLELKEAGFLVHMDDFGAGYFSLSNLTNLPFDAVKLDKTLIDDIGNVNGDEVLKHIIELSHFLNMEVIAEGVETQEQINFLKKLNCDTIQGYFYSKPICFEDYATIVVDNELQTKLNARQKQKLSETADVGSLRITNDLKLQYLEALSSVYMTMHVINLKEDTTVEFATTTNVKKHVNTVHNAREQMKQAMIHTVAPDYIPYALDFTDLTTIQERMRGKSSLSRDFVGVHFGQFRAQFIVVSANETNEPEILIFTTQVIRANRQTDEAMVQECRTDELTGVLNKRAFLDDSEHFNKKVETQDSELQHASILFVQTLNLSETIASQGYPAGDELLCATALSITNLFGKECNVYRIEKDTFVALFDTTKISMDTAENALRDAAIGWMGNNAKVLHLAYNTVSISEHPRKTFEELLQIAKNGAHAQI